MATPGGPDPAGDSPIDMLVAVTLCRRSMGARPSINLDKAAASTRLGGVPEHSETLAGPSASPLEQVTMTPTPRRSISLGSPSFKRGVGGIGSEGRTMSGLPVSDLFVLTNDPLLQKRVMKADTGNTGRISRRDIIAAFQSEATAKKQLKWGLIIGGVLLAFCLLMLAANAALTYVVVSMSKETSVQTSGVMTVKDSSTVVGTGQAAEMADLLFAYHTPSEQSDTLLSLKSLMITSDSGAVSVYQVLSSNLVPGQRLEFIVVAPTRTAADSLKYSGQPAAEMVRIVISEAGVYEVRGTQATANRRKLLATPVGTLSGAYAGSITGQLASTASMACGSGGASCSAAANSIGCPSVPTCGADGKFYLAVCKANQAGTTVKCTSCGYDNASCARAVATRPAGMPSNLAWDIPGTTAPSLGAGAVGGGNSGNGNGRPAGMPGNIAWDGPEYVRNNPPATTPGSGTVEGAGNGGQPAARPSPPPPKPRPAPAKKSPPPPKPRPPPPKKSPPPAKKSPPPPAVKKKGAPPIKGSPAAAKAKPPPPKKAVRQQG